MTQIRKKSKSWCSSTSTTPRWASHRRGSGNKLPWAIVLIVCLVGGWWFLSISDSSSSSNSFFLNEEASTAATAKPIRNFMPLQAIQKHRQDELLKRQHQRNLPRLLVYQVPTTYRTHNHNNNGKPIGIGHFMQGLLAAHMLAHEFNRTVCVEWPHFQQGFEYQAPLTQQHCHSYAVSDKTHTLSLWTDPPRSLEQGVSYELTPEQQQDAAQKSRQLREWADQYTTNECDWHAILSSHAPDHATVLFQGNTYPRWHKQIPPNLMEDHYVPRFPPHIPQSTDILIHLRAPPQDQDVDLAHANPFTQDKYRGLDDKTLYYMGHKWEGPQHTLVTNRPDLYAHRFQECCGWNVISSNTNATTSKDESPDEPPDEPLSLWRDWYALYKAPTVYHSNSEFARSATHWNPSSNSFQLRGLKRLHIHGETRDVLSFDSVHYHWEEWKSGASNAMIPLKQRTLMTAERQGYVLEGFRHLQNCPDADQKNKKQKGIRGFFQNRQQKEAHSQ